MQSNKEALREFLRGAALTVAMTVGIGLVIVGFSKVEKGVPQKFAVVDSYGTCAIVRYTDPSQQWHYFLDCGNQHLEQVR